MQTVGNLQAEALRHRPPNVYAVTFIYDFFCLKALKKSKSQEFFLFATHGPNGVTAANH